jgi:putative membrane protein
VLDLSLAIAHHLFIFAIFGALLAEFVMLRRVAAREDVVRVAAIDLWYGIFAAMVLLVGFSRAIFAAKGWAYYAHNVFFWAKLGTFATIGILSIRPSIVIARWRRAGTMPEAADIRPLRLYLHLELGLFILLLIFAAAMARGYGQY